MIKIIKKIKGELLPILDTILVKNGKAHVTDLENTFIFNTELEDALYVKSYFEVDVPVVELDQVAENFPKIPEVTGITYGLTRQIIEDMFTASKFTGKDDLRPIMTGIHLDEKGMCGTDAHALFFKDADLSIETPIIITKIGVELLKMMGADVKMTIGDTFVKFENDDHTLYTRLIIGKYPNFRAVLPSIHTNTIHLTRKDLLSKLKMTKAATKYDRISLKYFKGQLTIRSMAPEHEKFQLSTPCIVDVPNAPVHFGVNLTLAIKIFTQIKSEGITIKFDTANRGLLINENFLLMPIMLNT